MNDRDALGDFLRFLTLQAPVLARWPDLLSQQAANQPSATAVARTAAAARAEGRWPRRPWLARLHPPEQPEAGPIVTLRAHDGEVTFAAVSADGRRLISGGVDGDVRIGDLESGRETARIRGVVVTQMGGLWRAGEAVVAACGGGWIAVGRDRAEVAIHRVSDGVEAVRLRGMGERVRSVAVSPDGRRAAALLQIDDWTRVHVWDLPSGDPVDSWDGDGPLAFSSDGALLIDGRRVRDLDRCQARTIRSLDLATIPDAAFESGPGLTVFARRPGLFAQTEAPGGGRETRVFLVGPGKPQDSLSGASAVFAADGRLVATATESLFFLTDVEAGEEVAVIPNPYSWAPVGHWLAADPPRLIVSGKHGQLTIWDLRSARIATDVADNRYTIRALAGGGGTGRAFFSTWSFDDSVTGIRALDLTRSAPIGVLVGHDRHVTALALSPDGRRLASGDEGGTVIVWDLAATEVTSELESLPKAVTALEFAPDGRLLYRVDSEVYSARQASCSDLTARAAILAGDPAIDARLAARFGDEELARREEPIAVLALEEAAGLGFHALDIATGDRCPADPAAFGDPGPMPRTAFRHLGWRPEEPAREAGPPCEAQEAEDRHLGGLRVDLDPETVSVALRDEGGREVARCPFPEPISRVASRGPLLAVGGHGRGRVELFELRFS